MDTYGAYDSDGLVDAFYLKFLLPHTIALSSDEEVVVKMGGYDNFGVPKFNIMVASCKQDSNINREAESVVRSWVEEIGFDPNLFVYDVIIEYNYCVMK